MRTLLLLLIAVVAFSADLPPAPEADTPPLPTPDAADPFDPAAKPDAGAAAGLRSTSSRPYVDSLRAFCTEKGLTLSESGDGPVRLLNVGGATLPSADVIKYAKQTLSGYEMWTGLQDVFMAKAPSADDIYHLVVFKNDGDYSDVVDWLRAKKLIPTPPAAEDMTKKVGGFPALRVMFAKGGAVSDIPGHWAIYSTSCLAIDAFYYARGEHRPPAWIREGMAAEMQRIQLKTIRCTTIAYEERKEASVDNWAKEVARLITTRDQMAITASEITRLKIAALPGAHYRQMWSLCAFVRLKCGAVKGPENPFLKLMDATAGGESSEDALKRLLKLSDPGLTTAWRAWAVAQKK